MSDQRYIKSRKVFLSIMACLLIVIGLLIVFSRKHAQANFFIVVTFLINIVLFLVQLLRAIWKHPFSADMMFWLFNLFFFGYAPLLQHLTDVYAWELKPTLPQVLWTNLMVSLWAVCYLVGRNTLLWEKAWGILSYAGNQITILLQKTFAWWKRSKAAEVCKKIRAFFMRLVQKMASLGKQIAGAANSWIGNHMGEKAQNIIAKIVSKPCLWWANKKKRNPRMKAMDAMLAMALLITLYHIAVKGLFNLFSRATAEFSSSNTVVYLLTTHVFKNLVLFTLVMFIFRFRQIKRVDLRLILAGICMLLCCFPTALTRNMMASFYAGLLIIAIPWFRKGRWYSLAILCGLVLVFPAIEMFRHINQLGSSNLWELLTGCFSTTYLGGHYDAHQMIISVLKYVDQFGITWGRQLLGAMLFFVPRTIWPDKPIGTGHFVFTELQQYSFTNVSSPLVAEGYINFGVVGVVIFALAVGIVCRIADERYWNNKQPLSWVRIVYPFVIFQFFFLLRGDMMSGGAYLMAQLIIGSLVYWFVTYRTKKRSLPGE